MLVAHFSMADKEKENNISLLPASQLNIQKTTEDNFLQPLIITIKIFQFFSYIFSKFFQTSKTSYFKT
jgi:hypothetical protein